MAEHLTVAQVVVGSSPITHPIFLIFGKWLSLARVPALGAGGRGFESHLPDHKIDQRISCRYIAGVAELADALGLGPSG